MAPVSDVIAAELRGLKAAYREAIGGTRKGPKRGCKAQDDRQENVNNTQLEASYTVTGPTLVDPSSQDLSGRIHKHGMKVPIANDS